VKREEGHVYVTTPVFSGASWRLIGGVVFTLYDKGGGLIEATVVNLLPYAVQAILSWSWGGVNGQVSNHVGVSGAATLRAYLPADFDATLEISAQG
jgi:hypothetical protein